MPNTNPPLLLVADDEPPHPAEHKLLSRTVADWLAERIISGDEAPGARLTETKLATEAGVSRSPVREALRLLQSEGLVDIAPRYGAQVAYIGIADVEELYACRMILEPPCTGLSVEALDAGDIRELDMLRGRMEHACAIEDPRRFLADNIAYFRALLVHCPNSTLRELVELTWKKAVRYWSIFARMPGYARGSLEQHRHLHAAVHERDRAAAERADRLILERALHEIVTAFEKPVGAR
ncbi:MAG TPA: GntR family transcriptional regulator [Gaiellaceae bacterium]